MYGDMDDATIDAHVATGLSCSSSFSFCHLTPVSSLLFFYLIFFFSLPSDYNGNFYAAGWLLFWGALRNSKVE